MLRQIMREKLSENIITYWFALDDYQWMGAFHWMFALKWHTKATHRAQLNLFTSSTIFRTVIWKGVLCCAIYRAMDAFVAHFVHMSHYASTFSMHSVTVALNKISDYLKWNEIESRVNWITEIIVDMIFREKKTHRNKRKPFLFWSKINEASTHLSIEFVYVTFASLRKYCFIYT